MGAPRVVVAGRLTSLAWSATGTAAGGSQHDALADVVIEGS
jgi:hypothetical protein